MAGIGLLNEKHLHASLKQWYAREGDRFEVPVDGFVIDIVRGKKREGVEENLLIEIQTRNLAAINSKLIRLTRSHQVRLIYPIVQEKWIVRSVSANNGSVVRRKSPKRGRLEDLFWELVSIPQLLSNPNFSLEVLMIREEEMRRYDRRRRKGWVLERRRLLEVLDQHLFTKPDYQGGPYDRVMLDRTLLHSRATAADWLAFVPIGLSSFTAGDLATGRNTRIELAQKLAYCLRHGRMIELIGKRGRANLYRVSATDYADYVEI